MNDSALVHGNDFDHDRIRRSLLLVADFLDGGVALGNRVQFRLLLQDFGVDEDVLTTEHQDQLDSLLELARKFNPLRIVEVVGRASRTGPERDNVALSERRCTSVTSYLLSGGLHQDRIGEVRPVGSSEPVLDVGPLEEPFNRSVEVSWAFDRVPRLPQLDDATMGWTVQFGQDVAWTFVGSQRLTLRRLDTGETRHGTFSYTDASLSAGIFGGLGEMFRQARRAAGPVAADLVEESLEQLPPAWQKFLGEAAADALLGLSVMPADAGAAVPLVNAVPLEFEMFEGPCFLLTPWSVAGPVGSASRRVQLVFGWPVTLGSAMKLWDVSAGLGSIFPEYSSG
jgi:hypothetical protein